MLIGKKYQFSSDSLPEDRFMVGKVLTFDDYYDAGVFDGTIHTSNESFEIMDTREVRNDTDILIYLHNQDVSLFTSWLFLKPYIRPILNVTYNKLWVSLNE